MAVLHMIYINFKALFVDIEATLLEDPAFVGKTFWKCDGSKVKAWHTFYSLFINCAIRRS